MRIMGGKEDARRNIPAPFNNDLMEALVRMSVKLLHDPAFCNAKVGVAWRKGLSREQRCLRHHGLSARDSAVVRLSRET